MKDHEIVARIQNRDENALDHVYKKYYSKIYFYISKKYPTLTSDQLKDASQDTIIIFWEKCNSDFILTSKLYSYLIGISNFVALKLHNSISKLSSINDLDFPDDNQENYHKEETIKILMNSINLLSNLDKEILTLFYFEKLNMAEIAQRLNLLNSDVAKTRKYKAINKLKNIIKKNYPVESLTY